MIVRPAVRSDLLGIGRVADAAHWASYDGLLRSDTIGRLIARDFGPSRLARRLLRGGLKVVALDGTVIAFCDSGVDDDGILGIDAIAVEPAARRRGAGSALLVAAAEAAGRVPAAAFVLLGNLEGEGFYEANGFVPGEIAGSMLFDEEIVERRWWRESVAAERTGRRPAIGG
jgi:GNAT superfamily N-acetyltransferase